MAFSNTSFTTTMISRADDDQGGQDDRHGYRDGDHRRASDAPARSRAIGKSARAATPDTTIRRSTGVWSLEAWRQPRQSA